jgi:hypothetical protein
MFGRPTRAVYEVMDADAFLAGGDPLAPEFDDGTGGVPLAPEFDEGTAVPPARGQTVPAEPGPPSSGGNGRSAVRVLLFVGAATLVGLVLTQLLAPARRSPAVAPAAPAGASPPSPTLSRAAGTRTPLPRAAPGRRGPRRAGPSGPGRPTQRSSGGLRPARGHPSGHASAVAARPALRGPAGRGAGPTRSVPSAPAAASIQPAPGGDGAAVPLGSGTAAPVERSPSARRAFEFGFER